VKMAATRSRMGAYAGLLCALLLIGGAVGLARGQTGDRPVISGETIVGETLTSSSAGESAVYKWQRCDPETSVCGDNTDRNDSDYETIVNNNTDPTYVLTEADLGMMIRVQAKGTSLGEQFVPSAPVGPVELPPPPPPPVNLTPPTIAGEAAEGQSLTADVGTWDSQEPLTFSFSWERCSLLVCVPIDGETGDRYDPTADDVGQTLRVLVTAANRGGETSAYSEATEEVAVAPPVLGESAVIDPACPLPVAEPGQGYQTVDQLLNVPVGTRINVAACVGELITVRNTSGKTQSVELAGSPFKFGQRKQGKPVVLLKLVGKFTKKPTAGLGTEASAAGGPLAQAAGKKFRRCKKIFGARKCRKLMARGDCLCRTSGVFASGTVRGSIWYLQDGPGYTFAKAVKHRLLVKDRVRKKKILLRQGESYTARNCWGWGCTRRWDFAKKKRRGN
jgi:hypothetical protein